METLSTKTIIYDCNCPLCNLYTNVFLKIGVLGKNGRVSFEQADRDMLEKLDLSRARHEIPLIDTETGEVLYGLDGLTLIVSKIFPATKFFITKPWFKKMLLPLYKFISYNRRVIAGTGTSDGKFDSTPDFSLPWRMALIVFGISFTGLSIYLFSVITGITQTVFLFGSVFMYFLLMLLFNQIFHKNFEQKIDYLAHLSVLGIIESTLFIATAFVAKFTGLTGLLFAAQGACRLFALWMHDKRVRNNHFSTYTNFAFALGAVALIVVLAILKNY